MCHLGHVQQPTARIGRAIGMTMLDRLAVGQL